MRREANWPLLYILALVGLALFFGVEYITVPGLGRQIMQFLAVALLMGLVEAWIRSNAACLPFEGDDQDVTPIRTVNAHAPRMRQASMSRSR
jgi:hypothetical protein